MKRTVKGTFSLKSAPLPVDETTAAIGAMRMSFEKKIEGALEATSVVSMIGVMNRELGSGGYVALEKVTGSLDGRSGSFCLQHSSLMDRNQPEQQIRVIPDSGTGALSGLRGELKIDIVDGQHFYTFDFELE